MIEGSIRCGTFGWCLGSMVCGRGKWRLGSAVPLGDEMLAGTGMADDCGLAFLGDYVCLRKFRPGRDTISSGGRA